MGTAERKAREMAAREQAFLSAALDLFERDDWEAVTIDQIAARAEYAKGTVYKHFASKAEIYARIALDRAAATLEAVQALDLERPVDQVIPALIDVYWRQFSERKAFQRLTQFVQRDDFMAGLTAATQARIAATDAAHLAVVHAVLGRAAERGEIPGGEMTSRLFAANALLMGALRLHPLWAGVGMNLPAPRAVVAEAILAVLRSDRI